MESNHACASNAPKGKGTRRKSGLGARQRQDTFDIPDYRSSQESSSSWITISETNGPDVAGSLPRVTEPNEVLRLKVEEQASHIAKLAEENRRYILENGLMKKKKNNARGAHINDTASYGNVYDDRDYPDHGNTEMEDKIMALQLQNSELSVCLEREKRLRKEAEARLQRDMGYIKRLEDSVQTLRGTRVIMDPSTYRQVAEAYMAAKRTPTRRPHTHNGVPGSGLVCDATSVSDSRQSFSHPVLHHTNSCPSTKSPSLPTSNPSYTSIEYPEVTSGLTKSKRDRGAPHQDRNRGFGVGTNTMNPWDYQQLLESLEDLDGGSSRGALS